jgi:hypothetical protein
VTGEGDRDEVLKQLTAEQEADKEPSPLEKDPLNKPRPKGSFPQAIVSAFTTFPDLCV